MKMAIKTKILVGVNVFSLILIILLSGCSNGTLRIGNTVYDEGKEYKSFTFSCAGEYNESQCNAQVKEFCESKGLFEPLSISGKSETNQLYPSRPCTCSYLCATEETRKIELKNPDNWNIICTLRDDSELPEDMNISIRYGQIATLNIKIIHDKSTSVTSVKNSGDFKTGNIVNIYRKTDESENVQELWSYSIDHGTISRGKLENGIIEISYISNQVSSAATFVCVNQI